VRTMSYRITRSELNKMKKKYDSENQSDRDFLEWWRRNHGTGYESFDKIEIVEGS